MEKLKNIKIPYIILTVCALILLLRAQYSFCWSDESFYFSTTNRFLHGDRIFVHEWFPTQLVSIILLPFQGIYSSIVGSNDGVILFFRILYVFFSLSIAIVVYRIIGRKYGEVVGLLAALFYQFYVHLNIATTNYYSLSVSFFLLAMLLIYDSESKKKLVLAGFFFALSVLSLPSLAVAYFVVVFIALICAFCLKNQRDKIINILIWTLAGIVIAAIPVLIYVLLTSGINGIIGNLSYVLSDEEHTTSLVFPFKNFFLSVYAVFGKKTVYLSGLLAIVSLLFSNRNQRIKYFIFALDFILFIYYFTRAIGHTGFIATAFLLFAMPLFFGTKKKNWKLFGLLFCGGLIFSMTYSYSSLCDLYVLSIGHQVAAIGGICFIKDYADEEIKPVYWICFAVLLVLTVQTMTLRIVNVYRDAPMSQLTERISQGPAKGLLTTKSHLEEYDEIISEIQTYEKEDGIVFFSKLLPWGYMETDMGCGALTTWRTKLNSERLGQYYKVIPEKIPTVIFVLKDSVGSYESCGDVVADPVPNENEMGGFIEELINSGKYDVYEEKLATVYVAR